MSLLLLRPVRPERENVCVMPDCMELTHGRGLSFGGAEILRDHTPRRNGFKYPDAKSEGFRKS